MNTADELNQCLSNVTKNVKNSKPAEYVQRTGCEIDRRVRKNPYASLAIASGAVALAALALGVALGEVHGHRQYDSKE